VAKKNRTLQILREHTLKKKKRPGRVRVDTDGAQSDSSDGSDLSETDDEIPRAKK